MRDTYHDHLDAVVDDLIQMCRLDARAVAQATAGLVGADLGAVERVIADDESVNALYRGVEMQAYDLLARQQPVAGDLRVLVTSLRIVVDLERAGDYAVHLAKIARRRHPASAVPDEMRDTFLQMGRTAEEIVRKAGDVIATRDLSLAAELEHDDDAMDDLTRGLFTQLLQGGGGDIEAAIDVTLAGRYYERLADHAVAVGRRITYMVTGEHSTPPA
jgi:phosphate transport system protein